MELKDLYNAVKTAKDAIVIQQKTVDALAAKVTAGEATIKVYVEGVGWSEVNTTAYWQTQYDKLLSFMTYAGSLDGLYSSLQTVLDAQLPTIPLPTTSATVVAVESKP